MPTFGETGVGPSQPANGSSNWKYAWKHNLPHDAATVITITAYIGYSGSITTRAGLYLDEAGTPTALKSTSGIVTNTSFTWWNYTQGSPPTIDSGDYWLCWQAHESHWYKAWEESNRMAYQGDAWEDGLADPFGGIANYYNWRASIYGTYTFTSIIEGFHVEGGDFRETKFAALFDKLLKGGFIVKGIMPLIMDFEPEITKEVIKRPEYRKMNPIAKMLFKDIATIQLGL